MAMSECPPVLIGEKVWWLGSGSGLPKKGIIRWIGRLPEISPDWAIGIELEERLPYGGVDGTWRGRELFKCKKNHGLLVPSDRVVAKGGAGLCREDAERLAKVVDKESLVEPPPRQKKQQGLLLGRHEDFASVHREAVRLRREQKRIAETLLERVGEDGTILPRSKETSSSDRRQKTQSGLFNFFKWFRRDRGEERCLSNPGSPTVLRRSESSLLGSVDSLFSTATATSFSFVRPWPRSSKLISVESSSSPPVAPSTVRISIREKYNLYASGSLARSLDDLRPQQNAVGHFHHGTLTLRKRKAPQPPTDSLPTTLSKQESEVDCSHRRTVSESAKFRRPSHIKGKRRAPPPPDNLKTPPDSPSIPKTPVDGDSFSSSQSPPLEVIGDCGLNTLHRKKKAPPPPPLVLPQAVEVSRSDLKDGLASVAESKREVRIGEEGAAANDTFSTDTLRLEKGVLKPAMERSYAQEPRPVPTSPVSPRPWYKRATTPSDHKDTKKSKDPAKRSFLEEWMMESGFPRRSNGLSILFSRDSSDDKRRSGVTMLANISQLDKEAAEIVKLRSKERSHDEVAGRNAKYFSEGSCQTEPSENARRASTRQLISLFNSITATVNSTSALSATTSALQQTTDDAGSSAERNPGNERTQANDDSRRADEQLKTGQIHQTQPTISVVANHGSTGGIEEENATNAEKKDRKEEEKNRVLARRGSGDSSSSSSSSSFKVWTGGSAVSRKLVVWSCPRCTLENARWRLTCEACDMWRPPMADYSASKSASSQSKSSNKEDSDKSAKVTHQVPTTEAPIDKVLSEMISTSQIHTLSKFKENKPSLYPRLDEMANLDQPDQQNMAKKDKLINIPIKRQEQQQQEEARTARLAYFDRNNLQKINCLGEPALVKEESNSDKLNLRDMLKQMKDSLPRQTKVPVDKKPTNVEPSENNVVPNRVEKKGKSFHLPMETSFDSKPLNKLFINKKESTVTQIPVKTELSETRSLSKSSPVSNKTKRAEIAQDNIKEDHKMSKNISVKLDTIRENENGARSTGGDTKTQMNHATENDIQLKQELATPGLVSKTEINIPIVLSSSKNISKYLCHPLNISKNRHIETNIPIRQAPATNSFIKSEKQEINVPIKTDGECSGSHYQKAKVIDETNIPVRLETTRKQQMNGQREFNVPIRQEWTAESSSNKTTIEREIPIKQEIMVNGICENIQISSNKHETKKYEANNAIRQAATSTEQLANKVTEKNIRTKQIKSSTSSGPEFIGNGCSSQITMNNDQTIQNKTPQNAVKVETVIPITQEGASANGKTEASGFFVTAKTTIEEIIKPGKVSSSAQTSSKVLQKDSSKDEVIIPVVVEEYKAREPMNAGEFASRLSQTTLNSDKAGINEENAGKSTELYLNTVALNRLLRRLEAAISGGQLDLAADLAKELALLRVSCSVVRQRHQPTDIMLEVQLEGRKGGCGKLNIRAKPWMKLGDLAARVERDYALPSHQQRWIINKSLADDPRATLASLGVVPKAPIFLYLVDSGEQDVGASGPSSNSTSSILAESSQGSSNVWQQPPCQESKATPTVTPPPRLHRPPPSPSRFNQSSTVTGMTSSSYQSSAKFQTPVGQSPIIQSPTIQSPTVQSPTVQSPIIQSPTTESPTGPMPLVELPMSPEPLEGWKCTFCSFVNNQEKQNCTLCSTANKSRNYNGVTIVEEIEENGHYEKLLELEKSELVMSSVEFECPVCLMQCQPADGIVLRECLHTFCRICLIDTVKYSDDAEVKCPYRDSQYTCDGILQEREIKAIVPEEVYEDHLAKSVALAESRIANAFHCKTADCIGWCIYEDNVNIFKCPVCTKTNCLTCQAIHTGLNCKEYQEQLSNKSSSSLEAKRTADMLQDMVRKGEAMECPTCKVVLMKKWGCDWLRCSVCRTEICWITRGPRWGPAGKGDTSGGCKCGVNGVRCHPKCTYCH